MGGDRAYFVILFQFLLADSKDYSCQIVQGKINRGFALPSIDLCNGKPPEFQRERMDLAKVTPDLNSGLCKYIFFKKMTLIQC